ncbi:sigma-54-dependent Fis family transcriptional regulator [Rubrivivax sp. RP6-9]|uniref:sigma-54-dependent Fis family transcriptional regulator n=1 Tax=Rubrivivax sp. RP6-9 TaxID=3415750 RepID=UPI003CC635D9
MDPSAQRQLAHAHAVRARGAAMPPDGLPAPELLDSWVRCMQAGLDPARALQVQVLEAAELQRRRERSEVARRLARAELETLSQQIAGSNFLLAFADREGVILDLYADNRFSMSDDGAAIVAGSCWSEALCGTNGLGTALAAGRPVAVTGLEHYFLSLGDISCTAAPVHDAAGDVVGVLDASSYFASRQHHTQALVQMAATHIENGLLQHQMRGHWLLALHPRPEFLGTLSAGLLAFDGGGTLQALNARARQLLQGLEAGTGTAFEALFGEAFDLVLARLQRQGPQRLRDSLGSALVAQLVATPARQAPRRAAVSAATHPTTAPATPVARAAAPATAPAAGPVHDDPAVVAAYRLAEAAVRLHVPVLIQGETGSGKEVLARHLHRRSGRAGAFVAVNCGALPAELIEAELFGYVGGAFTGARREGSAGLIAGADGGTLLLDEVGELPLPLQAALLRFLDDQVVRPVGGTTPRQVDVQLLAATHADLEAEAAARRFRSDLLYRLNTVRVDLPPLRARQDFRAAVQATLAALDPAARIDDAAIARLAQHRWPGNFRELRSVLTRALLQAAQAGSPRLDAAALDVLLPAAGPAAGSVLQQGASDLVRRAFERCGSVSETARCLGISRTTVYRHLRAG